MTDSTVNKVAVSDPPATLKFEMSLFQLLPSQWDAQFGQRLKCGGRKVRRQRHENAKSPESPSNIVPRYHCGSSIKYLMSMVIYL